MSESLGSNPESKHEKTDRTILQASLYLAAFAVLENAVINAVEMYYKVDGSAGAEWKKYVSEVLIYSDDTYESSCTWLLKNGVIKEDHHNALVVCKRRNQSIARGFANIPFQDIGTWDEDEFDTPPPPRIEVEKVEFEIMIDLMHRVEAWRAKNEYGLDTNNEEDELESILPVSVIGMMRIANLAFPHL